MITKVSPENVNNIQDFLKDVLVSDIMAHKRRVLGFRSLISVHQDESIIHVLKMMKDNDVVTIPVFSQGPKRRFLFLCTIEMILEWILFQEAFKDSGKGKILKNEGDWMKSFRSFMNTADKEMTMKIPVRDVLNVYPTQAKNMPLVLPTDSAAHLLNVFVNSSQRMQRVLVVDSKVNVVKEDQPNQMILSATDFISFLEEESRKLKAHDLKAVFGCNITSANMLFSQIQHRQIEKPYSPTLFSASINMSVMEVFRKLFMEDVSAMPIVDSRDKLCGTISASDLVHLNKDNLELLDRSLAYFMERIKSSQTHLKKNMMGSCTMEMTVATAMRRMLKHKVHRMWIMNDEYVPLGCVSFTDILCLLWSENLNVES